LPRKTDSNNPADWIFFAETDLDGICALAEKEISHPMCESKLAEVLEKILKAELIRQGWFLVKTHDLQELAKQLQARKSDLFPACKPLCDALAESYFADRYPGFDLEEPDWPEFRKLVGQVKGLLAEVKVRIPEK
jgi:HEPN domain-containing protein